MESKLVKVGIVGLGLVAASHFKGYKSHPNADVIAVCDVNYSRAVEFANLHDIPEVYSSLDSMLEQSSVDAIDIATPTFLHSSMVQKSANAGKHVHCEKPFCRTVQEGIDACKAVQRAGVKLLVGETYVFLSSHIKARSLIAGGEIGNPLQIRQRQGAFLEKKVPNISTGPSDRTWRIHPEQSGGGQYPWIYDHAVHFFSAAEYLMVDQRVNEVYAVSSTNNLSKNCSGAVHDPYTTSNSDIPIITWKYEDADKQGFWVRAERLNGKYDYMRGFSSTVLGDKGMIEVLGEGGHNLMWEGRQYHLILHRDGKSSIMFRFDEGKDDVWQSDLSYYSKGHINQISHFIDSILKDSTPRYTGENGTHAVQCVLATIKSANENRPVKVSEVDPAYSAY